MIGYVVRSSSGMAAPHLLITVVSLIILGSVGRRSAKGQPTVEQYVVSESASASIGLAPQSDDYVFKSIRAGGIVDDSLIAIIGVERAGIYDMSGRFLRWVISRGRGPGEVEQITASGVRSDGTIWVYDLPNLRCIAVTSSGEVVSEIRLSFEGIEALETEVIGPDEEGGWWLRREPRIRGRSPGEVFRAPTELRRVGRDGVVGEVWSGEGDVRIAGGNLVNSGGGSREGGSLTSQYLSRLLLVPHGSGVLWAWSDSTYVDLMGRDGRRVRVGRVPASRRPLPPEAVPEGARGLRGVEALFQQERAYPEIHHIFVGTEGSVWALRAPREENRASGPTVYRVSPEGPTAVLRSPGINRLGTPIGRERVLAKRRSPETGEEYVSLHRLLPGSGGGG